jgi:hypothetical protein
LVDVGVADAGAAARAGDAEASRRSG